ncbi:MAG TPA: DsrE family protein [Acidimicrobiales bacterium]|nr:DsrE family protein [Acidimicrobiales bacterium]
MAKTVIFLFHDDDASLNAGSHVAERVHQVAPDSGVELEVFCFGPAQSVLTSDEQAEVKVQYRAQIASLSAAGVVVGACVNAAKANHNDEQLASLGLRLEFARDAFVRWGHEGAAVISF